MLLNDDVFRTVVSSTPLIAIDLILYDSDYHIIVGMRNNKPAKGSYFVPGGRIRKSETLKEAYKRISKTEIGTELSIDDAEMAGVYEHHYEDSIFDNVSTHYIVIAYLIRIDNSFEIKNDDQHSGFERMSCEDHDKVHKYSQPYFDYIHNKKLKNLF